MPLDLRNAATGAVITHSLKDRTVPLRQHISQISRCIMTLNFYANWRKVFSGCQLQKSIALVRTLSISITSGFRFGLTPLIAWEEIWLLSRRRMRCNLWVWCHCRRSNFRRLCWISRQENTDALARRYKIYISFTVRVYPSHISCRLGLATL